MKIIIEKALHDQGTTDETREADALLRNLILMIIGAADVDALRELMNGYDTDYFMYDFTDNEMYVYEVIDKGGKWAKSDEPLLRVPFIQKRLKLV